MSTLSLKLVNWNVVPNCSDFSIILTIVRTSIRLASHHAFPIKPHAEVLTTLLHPRFSHSLSVNSTSNTVKLVPLQVGARGELAVVPVFSATELTERF